MRGSVAIASVELRRFAKDRSNIFFVLVLPLLLVLVLGSQFGGSAPSGRVVIAGADGSLRDALERELSALDVDVSFAGDETARDLVARARADVALFVSRGSDRAFRAGAALTLEAVPSSQPTGAATTHLVQTVLRTLSADQAQRSVLVAAGVDERAVDDALARAERSTTPPEVVIADVDDVEQELAGLGPFDLTASTTVLLFSFLSALAGSATLIQTRHLGVMRRTLAAPVSPAAAVAGQALGRIGLAAVQGVYIMGGSALLFGVDWGRWYVSLVVLVVFASVAAAVSMVLGSALDNEGAASGAGIGLGLVLAALGGCMTPLDFFPDTLRQVAHVTPHAWAFDAFAEVQRHDGGILDVAVELGVLAAMAAAVLALGSVLLRRSLDRAL
jgi:ABC-2 type transport system permease protein